LVVDFLLLVEDFLVLDDFFLLIDLEDAEVDFDFADSDGLDAGVAGFAEIPVRAEIEATAQFDNRSFLPDFDVGLHAGLSYMDVNKVSLP